MSVIISVIIPTFNRTKYLGDTLQSIMKLSYPDMEIIIVDGSKHEIGREIIRLAPFARYIRVKYPGLARQRNVALNRAIGEYILFLDSDDLILPNKFTKQIPYMLNDRSIKISYSNWLFTDASGDTIREDGDDHIQSIIPTLLYTNIAPLNAFLFDRNILIEHRGFCEDLEACEDWDLLIRLALSGIEFKYLPHVTATYRIHENSMSQDKLSMLFSALKVINMAFKNKNVPGDFLILKLPAILIQFADTISFLDKLSTAPHKVSLIQQAWRDNIQHFYGENFKHLLHHPFNNTVKLYSAISDLDKAGCILGSKMLKREINTWINSITL